MEQELTSAVSSPASELNTPAVAKPSLRDMTPDQRHSWRLTGEFPDAEPASSPATAAEPAATAATSEPASEPAHDDPDYKPKTAKRIADLLAENKRLKDAQAAPARREPAAPPAATTAPSKPDPEAFTYGTADPDYIEAVTDYKLALKEHQTTEKQRETYGKAERTRLEQSWAERRQAATEKHPDFAKVALASFKPGYEIHVGSPLDAWILESEHGAELLYALMKNPAEIRRLNSLPSAIHLTRELTRMEDALLEPTLKTLSTAPEPGPTLSARAGEPVNAVRAALKKRDVGSYIRERNREEIASRRGH